MENHPNASFFVSYSRSVKPRYCNVGYNICARTREIGTPVFLGNVAGAVRKDRKPPEFVVYDENTPNTVL